MLKYRYPHVFATTFLEEQKVCFSKNVLKFLTVLLCDCLISMCFNVFNCKPSQQLLVFRIDTFPSPGSPFSPKLFIQLDIRAEKAKRLEIILHRTDYWMKWNRRFLHSISAKVAVCGGQIRQYKLTVMAKASVIRRRKLRYAITWPANWNSTSQGYFPVCRLILKSCIPIPGVWGRFFSSKVSSSLVNCWPKF